MQKLKISGSITTDPFKILSEEKSFYQELYTSKNLGNEQATEIFLNSLNIPRLTDEQSFLVKVALRRRSVLKLYKVVRVTKLLVMTDFQSNFIVNFGKLLVNLSSPVSTRFSLVVKCHAPRNRGSDYSH